MSKPTFVVEHAEPRKADYEHVKDHSWAAELPAIFADCLAKKLNKLAADGYTCEVHIIPISNNKTATFVIGHLQETAGSYAPVSIRDKEPA